MAETDERWIVLWLDDMSEEIGDEVASLREAGYEVITAQSFVQLKAQVQELGQDGQLGRVVSVVLDIMIEGAFDISTIFRNVGNGHTANGYAAGLVFLEQVLVLDDLFKDLSGAQIVINSKRSLSEAEERRVAAVRLAHAREIRLVEKASVREVSAYVKLASAARRAA